MSSEQQAALERLIRIAQGDSGQCRIVANFLLAWWNAPEYGGFDLTDLWAVDAAIAAGHAHGVRTTASPAAAIRTVSATTCSFRSSSIGGGPSSTYAR